MQTLETSRGRLEFRYDRRAQGCVLLLNGGHTNPDMRDSERYFIDRGHGVISVARPGYCHTSAKLDEAFGGFERAVGELLDHLDLTAVKVLGVSAGGRSAMRFAQLLPERCTHLVLFSSTSFQPWPGTALRLGTYLGFNPVAERFTWAILRSALRKWPQWTTERLFSSLTTLDAQEELASYSAEARRDIFELFMEMRSGQRERDQCAYPDRPQQVRSAGVFGPCDQNRPRHPQRTPDHERHRVPPHVDEPKVAGG